MAGEENDVVEIHRLVSNCVQSLDRYGLGDPELVDNHGRFNVGDLYGLRLWASPHVLTAKFLSLATLHMPFLTNLAEVVLHQLHCGLHGPHATVEEIMRAVSMVRDFQQRVLRRFRKVGGAGRDDLQCCACPWENIDLFSSELLVCPDCRIAAYHDEDCLDRHRAVHQPTCLVVTRDDSVRRRFKQRILDAVQHVACSGVLGVAVIVHDYLYPFY